jgi:hypothetical protein
MNGGDDLAHHLQGSRAGNWLQALKRGGINKPLI